MRVRFGDLVLDPGTRQLRRGQEVRHLGGKAVLEDLGSKNGTFCRGQRISAPVPLSDGDEIRLGKVPLTLRVLAADPATRTDQSRWAWSLRGDPSRPGDGAALAGDKRREPLVVSGGSGRRFRTARLAMFATEGHEVRKVPSGLKLVERL